MDKYEEAAADIIDIVIGKIEEIYPELKPKQEFLDESKDASILFGVAYYDTEDEIATKLRNNEWRLNLAKLKKTKP